MALVDVFLEDAPEGSEAELIKRIAPFHVGNEDKVRQLLQTRPTLIAKDLELAQGEQLRGFLAFIGASVRIEEAASSLGSSKMNETVMMSREQVQNVHNSDASGTPGKAVQHAGLMKRLGFAFRVSFSSGLTLLPLALVWLLLMATTVALMMLAGNIDAASFIGSDGFVLPAQEDWTSLVTRTVSILVALLLQILITAWFVTALFRLPTLWLEQGGRPPLRELMRDALARAPDAASSTLLTCLLPALLLVSLPVAASGISHGDSQTIAIALLIALGLSILFGLAIILLPVVVANENLAPATAIIRSWALGDGIRLRLIGNLLLLSVLMLAVMLILQIIIGTGLVLASPLWIALQTMDGIAGTMISIGVGLLVGVFLTGIALMLYTLPINLMAAFYYEARVLGEGWKPNWPQGIHPDWPLLHEGGELMEGRLLPGLLHYLLVSGIAALLLIGTIYLSQETLAHWINMPPDIKQWLETAKP